MLTIFVLRGLPASGKSTWSKKKVLEYPNTVIVNRDSIRTMLKGEYKNFPFGSAMEKLVTKIEEYSVNIALSKGYNVILDATNFRSLEKWYMLAANAITQSDVAIEIVDFTHVDLKTCIQRDQQRENPVGKEIIIKMAACYLKK